MSDTTAKSLVREVFEAGFGRGELGIVERALAPDAVDRHAFADDEPDMVAHLKNAIGMFRAAIPDLGVTVSHLLEDGDFIAARVEMTGHHTGSPLLGIAAQGKAVAIEQFHIVEVDSDKRGIRHWANVGIEQIHAQLA